MAKAKNVDVAVTPEYTVPWEGIESYLSEETYPSFGKLWILGFESIKIEELNQIISEGPLRDCEVVCESISSGTEKFLDPVLYITWTKKADELKKLIIIQFKTSPMGARGVEPIEKQNLALGTTIYLLKNTTEPSIDLFTLICAEAMEFNKKDMSNELDSSNWYDRPHLIFSLQLNPKPFHEEFVEFRRRATYVESNDLISVNLSCKSKINNQNIIDYGASSIFVRTKEPNVTNRRIAANESFGLFVTKKSPEVHSYYFEPNEKLYLCRIDRPSYSGSASPLTQKEGPVMIEAYSWSEGWSSIDRIRASVDDYLSEYGFEGILNFNQCSLERERLVEFSTGKLNLKKLEEWFKFENLNFFKLGMDDTSSRISIPFLLDESTLSKRNTVMGMFKEFLDLLEDSGEFFKPKNYKTMRGDRSLGFIKGSTKIKSYLFNVKIGEDGSKCTALYLGIASEKIAKKIHNDICRIIDDGHKGRVVVWYKNSNALKFYESKIPTITDAEEIGSIAG